MAILTGLFVGMIGVTAAQAAASTISSFTPTSGPVGTIVVITGTGFKDTSPVTGVTFNGTAATTVTFNSDTQITATVPTGATTGPIATVGDSEGNATSATNFTIAAAPVPTITSFTPTSGAVGTIVTITGTGLSTASAVKFGGVSATTYTVNTDSQITATVPTGATTGPISVTTAGGTATSTASFTVGATTTTHDRGLVLKLKGHLVARGRLSATDGFAACESFVKVKIQRRNDFGAWRTVGSDMTNAAGKYVAHLADREGAFRAKIMKNKVNGGADVCAGAISPVRRHQHS